MNSRDKFPFENTNLIILIMETKLFFRKIEKITLSLENELAKLNYTAEELIPSAETALMLIDQSITEIKEMVVPFQFECMADEIHFFKNLKPKVISQFIYYSEILHIETSKPNGGQKQLRKYYENELIKLKFFHEEYRDFYNYYRRKATYMDFKYFLRKNFDLKMKLSRHHHNFDSNFTTPYDNLLSTIMANDLVESFLHQALEDLGNLPTLKNKSTLNWTGTKAGLVELIFALYHSKCINGGNVELVELMSSFGLHLNIDLGNFYKTITEIKNRKSGGNKFLQNLNDSLNQLFSDEFL